MWEAYTVAVFYSIYLGMVYVLTADDLQHSCQICSTPERASLLG